MRLIYFFLLILLSANSIFAETPEQVDARRQAFIREFIETYKLAYEKEQIGYIEKFFSDDALIITETKELKENGKEIAPNSTKARPYKLLVENRTEYIKRLKEIFAQNKKISLGLSNLQIVKHPKYSNIYGVYFFQVWNDEGNAVNIESKMPGFIFLMIDFKNREMAPLMHVRTWQPRANIKKPSDRYSLEDFHILNLK